MKLKLRTKPTQFVKGKTEETLCDIMKRYFENKFINGEDYENNDSEINEHLIDIIVTNKSLVETEQWKYRTESKFKQEEDINIDILSSKSNDYKNISKYIENIDLCNDKTNLPNVLIVCYHEKRVCSDIIKLCGIFGGIHKKILPNIKEKTNIKFHITLDEPDANIGVTKKFLKKIKPYIENDTIKGILFITATPVEEFWNMLLQNGIKQLLNTNRDTIHNFDEDLKSYVSFKDHNVIPNNNNTNNPLDYIAELFSKGKIKETTRKIIFAPGHIYTNKKGVGSHDEIKAYFLGKLYTVLLMNGKFKGFIYPNGDQITIDDYNIKYGIEGELRNTLQHWGKNNKETNLAITGYWVIERGVTFNTIDFNFTDLILSNYHLRVLKKLIQLVGRGAGGVKYVNKMNVFCTIKVKEAIELFNEQLNQICSLNPESFNRTDFSTNKNTIPVKLEINDPNLLNELIELKKKAKRGYKITFHDKLVRGIESGSILIYDKNNINKFNINSREIKDVRMYDKDKNHNINSRRFKNFSEAFHNFKTISQTCDETQYNIDLAKDKYILNDFVNEINIFWITYKV